MPERCRRGAPVNAARTPRAPHTVVDVAGTLPRLDDGRAQVADGARSAGEAAFLRLVTTAGLPQPELNARIDTPLAWFLLAALWREREVGAEIGREWHLGAAEGARDRDREGI